MDGFVDNPMTMTIAELRENFEVVTQALHIECGGNGRAAFDPPARGNQWTVGRGGLLRMDGRAPQGRS